MVILSHVIMSHVILSHVILSHVILSHVILCHVEKYFQGLVHCSDISNVPITAADIGKLYKIGQVIHYSSYYFLLKHLNRTIAKKFQNKLDVKWGGGQRPMTTITDYN